MTIQEAAQKILEEFGRPLGSKEIAGIALERRMVFSNAQDPAQSHAQTIEKNIRGGVYNKPRLVFIHGEKGRMVGLPSWETKTSPAPHNASMATDSKELKARVPSELLQKIQLATQAKLAKTFDETVTVLLRKGLSAVAPDIKRGLLQQLDEFNSL